jgi:hypothetical protein
MLNLRNAGLIFAVVAISACGRQQTTPELQTTSGNQARNQPVDVTGCLRAGEADDTFVLTASHETPAENATSTYQLKGPDRLDLKSYVGKTVEVIGTMRAEQAVTSDSGATQEKAAKGTSGTPTVETKTNLNVRQVSVDSVKAIGDRCPE